MTTLTALRAGLAEGLETSEFSVFDYVPGTITPPMVVIAAGDPWIEQGDTFSADQFLTHFQLTLISGTATGSGALTDLEEMLTEVLSNIDPAWTINAVSEPYISNPNNSQFLTCQIEVSQMFQLTS